MLGFVEQFKSNDVRIGTNYPIGIAVFVLQKLRKITFLSGN